MIGSGAYVELFNPTMESNACVERIFGATVIKLCSIGFALHGPILVSDQAHLTIENGYFNDNKVRPLAFPLLFSNNRHPLLFSYSCFSTLKTSSFLFSSHRFSSNRFALLIHHLPRVISEVWFITPTPSLRSCRVYSSITRPSMEAVSSPPTLRNCNSPTATSPVSNIKQFRNCANLQNCFILVGAYLILSYLIIVT